MRERLEEIKSRVWKEKCTYAKGDDESREGYSYTLSDYDFEWLIKQAEKVEHLENTIKETLDTLKRGGPGTRSQVQALLENALEGKE